MQRTRILAGSDTLEIESERNPSLNNAASHPLSLRTLDSFVIASSESASQSLNPRDGQTNIQTVPQRVINSTFLTNGFLPLIDPTEPIGLWHFWPRVWSPAIGINYLKLVKVPSLLKKARSDGIKRAIGYHGKVASVLVGDNRKLDLLDVENYAADIDKMGFDAATCHDDYVYSDDSDFAQWSRIHSLLDKAAKLARLDPDAELVGIVQGADYHQIEFCVDELLKLGISRMALPCSDLISRRKPERILEFSRICRKNGLWHWLIGINSPSLMSRFQAEVVSGYGWCYYGAKRRIYRDGQITQATPVNFCKHSECRKFSEDGLSIQELCSRHNVLYSMEFLERRREKFE